MTQAQEYFLFEVSWEVFSKAGGVYTVITSKLPETIKFLGERYFVIGPDLKTSTDFEETDEKLWNDIREGVAIKEIACRFGRWKVPGRPKAILVGFAEKYDKDQLLYRLWEDYGVDSIAGGWDYVEPVMFSYAASEVIETINNIVVRPKGMRSVAHFHEWNTGAGLLGLKKQAPEIGTVFTAHKTMLGKTLSSAGVDIYSEMDHISPQQEASIHNITAKYSLEVASVREADCFTAISQIIATEAKNFLGRSPDIITPNGICIEDIKDLAADNTDALKSREKLLAGASRFLGSDFPKDTKILMTSGRGELYNKGIDVFLSALGRLSKELQADKTILVYIFVLGKYTDLIPSLKQEGVIPDPHHPPISTYKIYDEASDPILQTCESVGLKNLPDDRVKVIYIPSYLNGHDGLINMPYYEALSGCDLSVFPSHYEPWGYTPLESAAYAVPTITTDQAGFGLWVQQTAGENKGVILLKRMGQSDASMEENLHGILSDFTKKTSEELQEMRAATRSMAVEANWKVFFKNYIQAFEKALSASEKRAEAIQEKELEAKLKHTFAGISSVSPHFRNFRAVANLPQKIARLRELAYNLWWAWNPHALELFSALDPKLWEEIGNNPVRMLETVSHDRLLEISENINYLDLYAHILKQFDDYMEEKTISSHLTNPSVKLTRSSPVAYFSTEYGLHECLPIYSGGLGTLSGDHLKTASDLNAPLVGMGLFYKYGFFKQRIDKNGAQTEEYQKNDLSGMPMEIVQDDRGNPVQISLELPGRTLFANIWEIHVGRTPLYLLDSDVTKNTAQDRKITDHLYCSDPKTRIEQEILLGVGGFKLLRKLGIRPRVYHMNEGHSAFLVFEFISFLMTEDGLSFNEASEVVHSCVTFTTHTPIEAGNERFSQELMEHYFSGFVKRTGISWPQFWQLGLKEDSDGKSFFMTILALKMAHKSNAVSWLHEEISKRMWRNVWKGLDESDIPITHVTNGIHTLSYIAPRMKSVFNTFLGMDWYKHLSEPETWEKVQDIPDNVIWRTRYELRQKLIDFLRDDVSRNWMKYGYSKTWQEELFSRLNPAALTICFARRFVPYKRANLILSDLNRLDRLVNHPTKPVQIVFAGKAHPQDGYGKDIIKQVIDISRDPRFRGRIFFIEGYNIGIARRLVQGADVWLNNPRRPQEASGTSGEKVVANGVINLSVSDGWWIEGYDGTNGWTIGPVIDKYAEETPDADREDGESLYSLLENSVIPMFYEREASGLPERWIAMIKRSMQTLIPRFNTERMLTEYYQNIYIPTTLRAQELYVDNHKLARELADWKQKLPMRFSSLRLLDVTVKGLQGDTILVDEPLEVSVRIDPGKMAPEEIMAELLIGKKDHVGFFEKPECIPLKLGKEVSEGLLTLSVCHKIKKNGVFTYGVRVFPHHPNLAAKYETNLIYWG